MGFQNARQHLSIIQVAEYLGYAYNKAKGRIRPQYDHPNGDKIIISNPNDNSRQMYFNRDGSDDKGSVIDFIKNRLVQFKGISYQKDMDGVNQVLKQFKVLDQTPIKPLNPIAVQKKAFDITNFTVQKFDPNQSTPQYQYLISRGLSAKTLGKFKSYIFAVKDSNANFYNADFPYKNAENETIGFELRNPNFKGHAKDSNRETGIWIANFATANALTRNVFLFESAIDAMSFYQIYQNKFDFETAAFISFGGGIANRQMDTVLNTFPQARYLSGFDNDFNGNVYDIVFERRINPVFQLNFIKDTEGVTVGHNGQKTTLSEQDFTLKKVGELIKQQPVLYVTKPKQGKDYNEMLTLLNRKVKSTQIKY